MVRADGRRAQSHAPQLRKLGNEQRRARVPASNPRARRALSQAAGATQTDNTVLLMSKPNAWAAIMLESTTASNAAEPAATTCINASRTETTQTWRGVALSTSSNDASRSRTRKARTTFAHDPTAAKITGPANITHARRGSRPNPLPLVTQGHTRPRPAATSSRGCRRPR